MPVHVAGMSGNHAETRRTTMQNVITFNVPVRKAKSGKVETAVRTGTIAWLTVGNRKVCFVLQRDDDGKPHALAHYASGMLVGHLNTAQVECMLARGHHARLTPRDAAVWLIEKAIARKGVDSVLAVMDGAPRLNAGRL
jgi:hypothetical protein